MQWQPRESPISSNSTEYVAHATSSQQPQDVIATPGRGFFFSASPATTQNVPSSTFGIDLGFIYCLI
jgi:hypothetical protein